MKYLLIFSILISSIQLFGQEEKKATEPIFQDVIYLIDGSVIRGKIIEYDPGFLLVIETWTGADLRFEGNVVKKVVAERIDITKREAKVELKRSYRFKEKGIYNTTDFSINFGQWDGFVVSGLSIENITGYQFNRLIGAGIGIGYETFQPGKGEVVIPIFAEARGYLFKRNSTPMFRTQIGYGIGLTNVDRGIVDAKGGLLFHPAVGYRFGAGPTANFTLDFGYKIQKVSFTEQVWDGTWTENHTFRRYTLRLGLLF